LYNQIELNFNYQSMKRLRQRLFCILIFLCFFSLVKSQETTLTLDTIANYKNWGWEALVIHNEYITVAIVPEMGGNILQYDFGVDTFLLLEPNTFGRTFDVASGKSPFDGAWGFGGYETWPTPEGWPPPPNMTYRKYSYVIETCNSDSIIILLKSEKETERFPGMKLERKISAFSHSTKVKVENTIINMNTNPVNYGMMNVNYVRVNHNNLSDYTNFSVSFPINQASKFGNKGVYFDFNQNSPSYLGQINPGIFSVEYSQIRGKVFADVKDGWGSYVDKKDSQAYIRVFDVFEGETYPDDGARLEVYVSPNPNFMAIEVMSPMKKLAANGGQYTFEDNLFSTKLNNTILKATHAGASTERLAFDSLTNKITGAFGVFYKGEVRLSYYDINNILLSSEKSLMVYPDTSIFINEIVHLPPKTNYITLEAYSADNKFIDILDQIDFSPKIVSGLQYINAEKKIFIIKNNMLKNSDIINYQVNNASNAYIEINIFDLTGNVIENVFNGVMPRGESNNQYQLKSLVPGIYFVIFSSNGNQLCDKIIVTD
jgi:hypothetical protein